jgi:hypothetical protein
MERTETFASTGVVVYDYFVDSQINVDELLVFVDGVVGARYSGPQLTGRGAVTVGAGTHTIRFTYKKDGNTDFGLDMAWIDNVEFVAGTSAFAVYSFDTSSAHMITDWTVGGDRGGWVGTFGPDKQSFRRPVSMAFAGNQPTERRAGISRQFSWPAVAARNELVFSYSIDSEPDHDWLRILVDGVDSWSKSGRNLRGQARIPIATPGVHEITVLYVKDTAGDEGRDNAVLDYLQPMADGIPLSTAGFFGSDLGEIPSGWTVAPSANAGGWETIALPSVYANVAQVDTARTVDGVSSPTEYAGGFNLNPNHTGSLPSDGRPKVRVAASSDGTMYFYVELPDTLGTWFLAGGQVDLLIDADADNNLQGLGCGLLASSPNGFARRFVATLGSGSMSTPSVDLYQQIGSCWDGTGDAWRDTVSGENWTVDAAAVADADTGSIGLELSMAVVRPAGAAVTSPVGFQLSVEGVLPGVGPETIVRLPWKPNRPLNWGNAATWEPVYFSTTTAASSS